LSARAATKPSCALTYLPILLVGRAFEFDKKTLETPAGKVTISMSTSKQA
jgi:hypothetical protein